MECQATQNGQLANGAVASVHVGNVPWAPSGYRMEIYGREGTLVASHKVSSQHGNLRLQGAQRGNDLQDIVAYLISLEAK